MTSYTDMARSMTAPAAAPNVAPVLLSERERFETWFRALPESLRSKLQGGLDQIAKGLPPVLQQVVINEVQAKGAALTVPLVGVDGLGCTCMALLGAEGLGQWEIAGALVNVVGSLGTQLVLKRQDASLQKSLQSNQLAADAKMQAAATQASLDAQKLINDAQLQATKMAQDGLLQQAQINAITKATVTAPVAMRVAMWGGAAAVVLALGGAIYLFRRSSRKK